MTGPRMIQPGASPNSWHARFQGGPMDGQDHGIVDAAELPQVLDWPGGRYRLLSASRHAPGADLTGTGTLRGCVYAWEVLSRAETPRLPGGQPHP